MDWQQKLAALQSIADTALRMRAPDDWFVSASYRSVVYGEGGGLLISSYGNGATPQAAVEDDWKHIAEAGHAIKVRDSYVRWNGFMWQTLTTEAAMMFARVDAKEARR